MNATRHLRSLGTVGAATAVLLLFGSMPAVAAGSDDPRGATKFRDLPYSDTTDASTATGSPDDPPTGCGGDPTTASVWYRFQPKANGPVTIDTFGSGYDTVLAVYTGDPGQSAKNLTLLVCNDDSLGLLSKVKFDGERNSTYFIMVDPYANGPAGNLVLHAS
jgi:hypothetical protein